MIIEQLKKFSFSASSKDGSKVEETLRSAPKYVDIAFKTFSEEYDAELGGFGEQPKFPRPVIFNFLFALAALDGQKNAQRRKECLDMSNKTLVAMANGGLYDHLGGGFHRYSVDQYWHIPHFEKMMYDQAQLLTSYCTAYQLLNVDQENKELKEHFKRVVFETAKYIERDMTHPEGGIFSAEDADSLPSADSKEKKEGAFYLWSYDEVRDILKESSNPKAFEIFCSAFNVKPQGNIRPSSDPHNEMTGKNHLYRALSPKELETRFPDLPEIEKVLDECREKLFKARQTRPRPHLDDKILTSWNALTISGLVHAFQTFQHEPFLVNANRSLQFIQTNLYQENRLQRSFREGPSRIEGYLDDYAFLIQALLDLYESNGDLASIQWAIELQHIQDELFWDNDGGGYFSFSGKDPSILLRMKGDEGLKETFKFNF
jgi:uncharacterized protein YyaL (SSP411 family)